jgi:3-hydroxybutyryl-CoA dehydratase
MDTRNGDVGWRERPPYFDGLQIGDAMESSGRTVTEYDVVSFAALTGDWHPQHADAAWAAESPFGRRPVGLGDTIRVQARVAELRPLGDEAGLVTLAVRIRNQDDELVARMEITVLWRREPERSSRRPSAGSARDAGVAGDELSPIQDGRVLA